MTRDDRGAATVIGVALLGVLLLVGAALGVVAAMVRAHRVAQSAADLSALAGASALERGGNACQEAGRIAEENGAALTACRASGRTLLVQVTVIGPHWLGQEHDLVAEARAGP